MRLGISTYSFPWAIGINDSYPSSPLTPAALLEYASSKNISIVQFGDNCPLDRLSHVGLQNLIEQARQSNIQIQVGVRKLTHDNLRRYIEITSLVKASYFRIVVDDDNYHPVVPEVIKTIRDILPELEAANIKIAIENHDRFPARVLKSIIKSTDENYVGICLDTANSLGAGEGIQEVLDILGAYTINLHIKDIVIKRLAHKMGFRVSGCIAGTGILNVPHIIAELTAHGLCDSAILEIWCDPALTIEETLQKEKTWVEESIQFLKTIIS